MRALRTAIVLALALGALFAPAAHAVFPASETFEDFNRADAGVSGATTSGGDVWSTTRIETGGANALRVIGNRGGVLASVQNGYLTTTYGPDVDVTAEVPVLPGNGRYIALYSRIQTPGSGVADYYGLVYTHDTGGNSSWQLRRYVNAVPTTLTTISGINLLPGDALGLRVTGAGASVDVAAYRRSSGIWSAVTSATDSSGNRIVSAGRVGLEIDDPATRIDNFGGGTVQPSVQVGGTSLSTGGCTNPSALAFPPLLGTGTAVTSTDCAISFGSADSTAQLRIRQADRSGSAFSRLATGAANGSFDGDGMRTYDPTAGSDIVSKVLALDDGSVLVVGIQGPSPVPYAIKVDAAGQLVTGFGTAGIATWDVPALASDYALDAAVQSDGKIVVVGQSDTDNTVTRLTATGVPDTTFSGDGFVAFDSGGFIDQANSVAIRPDGRIVVGGFATSGMGGWITQFDANGRRDVEHFGTTNGYAVTNLGAQFTSYDIALGADGSIYAAGANTTSSKPHLARFTRNGVQVGGFGGDLTIGTATTSGDVLAQTDGSVLMTATGTGTAYVAKWRSTGTLDPAFGTAGTRTLDMTAGNEFVTSLATDPLGDIVLGLNTYPAGVADSGIMRLLPDGSSDTRFDGDGHLSWSMHATDADTFSDVAVGPTGALTAAGPRTVGAGPDSYTVVAQVKGGSIPDYGAGGTWASGSMFGACLRTVSGLGTTATWTANAACPETDGAYWNAIPSGTTGGEIASTSTAGVVDATAALRFGVRSDGTLEGGSYAAPITVEVLSPNLDAPANTAVPTISGTTTVRRLLTASTGAWTGSATINFAYQWRRCDAAGASCVDIVGATASTYALTAVDAGSTIRVMVTASNTEGSANATSTQTAVIAASPTAGVSYMTGFEHRTASDVGGGLSVGLNPNAGGTATPDTTVVHSGTAAMRFDAAPGQYQWDVDLPLATQRSATARVYVNLQSYPTGNVSFTQLEGTVAADLYCEMIVDPSGTIGGQIWRGSNSAFGYQAGPTLELNHWYLIEYTCDTSNALHTLDWRVDGQTQTQVTANGGAPDWIEGFQFGIDSDTPWTIVIDDVAVSKNVTDYPLGPARTIAYKPNGIGAISTPAQWQWSVSNGFGPTAFVAGDANQAPGRSTLIDEWPVTTGASADLIEQTVNNATLDVDFANTAETMPPTAVSLVGAQRERTTGPNSSQVYAVSGGTQLAWTRDWTGGPTVLSYLSMAYPLAPGGTAWTTAKLDALQARLSGADAVPETFTDALLVEAEFPATQIAQNVTLPAILGAPKVGATLLATTGTWSPNPTAYAYQWTRCDATGAACVDIAAATSSSYVPVALDAGGTLRVRVTATTPAGNQSATSPQSSIVTPAAPTLTYFTGFESGTISTSGAGLMDTALNATASPDIVRTGASALRTSSDGSIESYATRNTSGTIAVTRFAIMFEELPTGNGELAELNSSSGASCDLDYVGGRFRAQVTNSQFSTMLIAPGRWYVVDMRCSVGGASHVMDWRIDGVPQATISDGIASSTIIAATLGTTGTTLLAGTVRYDDWAVSATAADYPIGSGKVVGMKPSGTLAHSTHASFDISTNGASSWTPLTVADDNQLPGSASLLDEWPIQFAAGVSGDLVRQVSTTGQLDYALDDPEETGSVNAVRVVGSHHAGTPANVQNVEVRARLGAGTSTPYSNEVPTGSISYHAGLLATRPGGGSWTGADLDALHLELDSTNAGAGGGDRPWTHALLAEADVPVGPPAVNDAPPSISVPYDVPKVGDELRAEDGTWSGTTTTGHRYAWLRCNASGAACAAISGANGPTYTLQGADAGSRLRVIDLAESRNAAQGARSAATELISTQPTTWYITGYEHGTSSAAGLGLVTQVDAQTTMDTAITRSGSYAMRSNSTGAGSEWEQDTPSTSTVAVARYSLYLDTLPSSNSTMIELVGGGSRAARLRVTPGGVVQTDFYDGTGGQAIQSGATLQTGRWYQIDMRTDGTTTTWRTEWRIDGVAQPPASFTQAAIAAFNQYDLGDGSNTTWVAHYDDVVYSSTATDFPIGNVRVNSLGVTGLGSGGTTANFGPTPSSDWAAALAEVPMSATSMFVQQSAITSSLTDHLPFTNADPASTQSAFAVRGIASYGFTAAGTNHVAMRVHRPGDTLAASPSVFSGNAEIATLNFAGAMIPAPTGGWTPSALSGTDWVVGFSTDVAPTPRVHGLLLETAYRG